MLLSIPGKAQSLLNIRDETGTEAAFVSGIEALAPEGLRFSSTSRIATSLAQLKTWAMHKHSCTQTFFYSKCWVGSHSGQNSRDM